jgi:predicted ATP-dependent endonuclease of OLD family
MNITRLQISNYKGLREIDIPISCFTCLIGENNAGKSSMLQAVALFLSGSQISRTHYFDASIGIRIGLTFEDISDSDIERLAEEHRERIRAIITDGRLALVRVYGIDGKGSLKYRKLHPKDTRFSDEAISELIKGLKGKTLADAVINQFIIDPRNKTTC